MEQMMPSPSAHAPESFANLEAQILALKQELAALKQEKADLEILLDATAEHSDSVEAELHSTAIAALKQSEEMFRTLAAATPVPVLISRIQDGTILYANVAASATLGLAPEAYSNHSTLDFYCDLGDRQRLLEQVEREGAVQNVEIQCQRTDGCRLWVSASLQLFLFQGEPTLLTALCDITQRKLDEEALKRQVEAMQIEINQAKRRQQVTEIVQSDYFQELQAELANLRGPDGEDF
jgi:PAS domain S-box-containing protein